MKTVGQIVRQRREALGLTLAAVADAAGVTKGYLSMLENHRLSNPPSRKVLEDVERALGLEGSELVRAADWQNTPAEVRGEIARLAEQAERSRALAEWLKASTSRKAGGGKNLDKLWHSGRLQRKINEALGDPGPAAGKPAGKPRGDEAPRPLPLPRRVPLINKVAAGYPTGFTDLDYPARVADDYVHGGDLDDPDAFAATVLGESMLPDYRAGDIVIFSPAAAVTDGCDCFVRLEPDHECTFKRVFLEDGGKLIRLQPLNPRFPPQTVPREGVAGMYRAVQRISKL
jgi:phage repressor protein C with HTH and peptisase S24 domain